MNTKTNKKAKDAQAALVVEKNVNGLTLIQQKQGEELQAKMPTVVEAVTQTMAAERGLRSRYIDLVQTIRDVRLDAGEGAMRTPNRREIDLLLRSLGYPKQRVTEVCRVVEVPEAKWLEYRGKELGFKAVLAITRAEDKPPVQEPLDAKEIPPDKPKKELKLTAPQQDALVTAGNALVERKIKPTVGDEGYQFTYTHATGSVLTFRLFVDAK